MMSRFSMSRELESRSMLEIGTGASLGQRSVADRYQATLHTKCPVKPFAFNCS